MSSPILFIMTFASETYNDRHSQIIVPGPRSALYSGTSLMLCGDFDELHCGVPAGPAYLACTDPVILADTRQVVFRCGGWIMVMDVPSRRVGKLVLGDSIVLETPVLRRDVTTDEH